MKKNMAKGLATALSLTLMASVVAPVGSVFAATPDLAKRYGNVYQGGSYKYTTKNSKGLTVKWTVTGKSKDSIKLASTTGTSNSIKVDTKGKKASTATVEARFYKKVKKNGKNVYQLVKKRIDNVTVKVSAKSVSINNKVESLKVNQEYDFNRTMTPSNATSKTYWAVTTKDGKETQDASVDKNGVFKASKAGEYVVTATSRNSANAKVRGTDSVTFKVVDAVVSARQTKSNSAEVELTSDISVKADDFSVIGPNNVRAYVKSVKQTGKIYTLEFYNDLTEKSTYNVNFRDTKVDFSTTDGTIVDIALDKLLIQAATPTEIKVQLKDANGVIVKEEKIHSKDKLQITHEVTGGSVADGELTLFTDKDFAKFKVVYHTYQYDETGKEKGVVERTFEVRATNDLVNKLENVRYTIDEKSVFDWINISSILEHRIPQSKGTTKYLHIDTRGLSVQNNSYVTGKEYIFHRFDSSDPDKLRVVSRISDKNILEIQGVEKGTYYILAKDDKGNVVATFPVTVVEPTKYVGVKLDRYVYNFSKDSEEKGEVKVEVIDQYNKVNKEPGIIDYKCLSKPNGANDGDINIDISKKGVVKLDTVGKTSNIKVGTYEYLFETVDKLQFKISVKIVEPLRTSVSYTMNNLHKLNVTLDNTVSAMTRDIVPTISGNNGYSIRNFTKFEQLEPVALTNGGAIVSRINGLSIWYEDKDTQPIKALIYDKGQQKLIVNPSLIDNPTGIANEILRYFVITADDVKLDVNAIIGTGADATNKFEGLRVGNYKVVYDVEKQEFTKSDVEKQAGASVDEKIKALTIDSNKSKKSEIVSTFDIEDDTTKAVVTIEESKLVFSNDITPMKAYSDLLTYADTDGKTNKAATVECLDKLKISSVFGGDLTSGDVVYAYGATGLTNGDQNAKTLTIDKINVVSKNNEGKYVLVKNVKVGKTFVHKESNEN